jgi:hypothetical protein
MQSFPNNRFARLRHEQAGPHTVTTTLLGATATAGDALVGNSVIADIAKTDPARAQLIMSRMRELIAHNDAVMSWLEADPAHAAQFAADPLAAVREAIPDLPANFFAGWRAAGDSG